MTRQFAKRLALVAASFAVATGYACTCSLDEGTTIECTPKAVGDGSRRIALSCIVTAGSHRSPAIKDTIPDPNQ
jgi:hypothetical protein